MRIVSPDINACVSTCLFDCKFKNLQNLVPFFFKATFKNDILKCAEFYGNFKTKLCSDICYYWIKNPCFFLGHGPGKNLIEDIIFYKLTGDNLHFKIWSSKYFNLSYYS